MATTKPNNNLFDKSYQESKASTYKLYVEVSYSSVKQTVLDTLSNTFIGFKEHTFTDVTNDFTLSKQLSDFVKTDSLMNQSYKAVLVSFVNNRATLIPNAIFKNENLDNYHQFNFSIQEDDSFFADRLINLNAHNVYSISKNITKIFSPIKNARFMHFSSALIEASLMDSKANKAISSIYVNVNPKNFQLIVIKNQKLELYNSFNYQSGEDFIYYLLFVLDQLNIDNENATINLSGDIDKASDLYNLLFKYIKTLNFVTLPGQLQKSYVFEEVPKHSNYALFNQYLCE